jgi:Uma2 family endonuclease
VVEIAASSVAIDLGNKLQAYRRNGVQEYIVWRSFENQLSWYHLVEGEYQLLVPNANGLIHSHVFPGLYLDVESLLNNQMMQVLESLRLGLDSDSHSAFVEQLKERGDRK